MATVYDKYYESKNYFGDPYPELIDLFASFPKGKLLDLGSGQGRNAISLARMGFDVLGIDHSEVGISQMEEYAVNEKLELKGLVEDIYGYSEFYRYEYILLDNMFHFNKRDLEKEKRFLKNIFQESKIDALITIAIQALNYKIRILDSVIEDKGSQLDLIHRSELKYRFEDKSSNHFSETNIHLVILKKV